MLKYSKTLTNASPDPVEVIFQTETAMNDQEWLDKTDLNNKLQNDKIIDNKID